MIVAGIGCKIGIEAEAVRRLVQKVCELGLGKPFLLAVPEFRRDEAGIAQAAEALGLPIVWLEREGLRAVQGRCLTHSARAEREVGLASVAEAAALAAAGPGGRLILPRIAAAGVTCALAQGPLH
jgi:cobalt-precorrin 5A hydrolase